jgi:ribosomal protein S18 acetylase RimI-like enzyme
MADTDLYERMLASMEGFFTVFGEGDAGGRVIRRDGLMGAVCPSMPDRSVFNSVIFRRPEALEDALDDLAAAYAEAGARAWTVWVPRHHAAVREVLKGAGHVLDAAPQAMAAPLAEIALGQGADGTDWERAPQVADMCAVLEEAFGWERQAAARVFAHLPDEGHIYVGRDSGQPVACVAALDVDGDCGIWNVGTRAAFRGRGLATALMRQALLDARDRGATTTSLQATAMGRPVYRRMGYRELGEIEMWERRAEEPPVTT